MTPSPMFPESGARGRFFRLLLLGLRLLLVLVLLVLLLLRLVLASILEVRDRRGAVRAGGGEGRAGDEADEVLDPLAEVADVGHQLVELLLQILRLEEDATWRRRIGLDRGEGVEHVFQAPAQPGLALHRPHGRRAECPKRVTGVRSRATTLSTRGS